MNNQLLAIDPADLDLMHTIKSDKSDQKSSFSILEKADEGAKGVRSDFRDSSNNSFFFRPNNPKRNIEVANVPSVTPSGLTTESIKASNRELTRKTLLKEQDKFIEERSNLVRKKFQQGLTRTEERQLQYIDWQLDRIEDASIGENLDQFELLIQAHENLAHKIGEYTSMLRPSNNVSKHRSGRQK